MPKDSPRIRGTTPQIEQAARHLRQNLTPAEAHLWQALRYRQLAGLKFRCQHPIGSFIADFYCPSCKLVIEVDGGIHTQRQNYDQARTDRLESFGFQVLRFTNQEVLSDLPGVLARIVDAASTYLRSRSTAENTSILELKQSRTAPQPPTLGEKEYGRTSKVSKIGG